MRETTPDRSLLLPALGTALFALAVGAPLVVLVPWVLAGGRHQPPLVGGEASRWVGAALLLAGLPVWGAAALRFVRLGQGTPAPIAPPTRLVVAGPYRHVRNPMYVAALAMVAGQALLLGSAATAVFGLLLALAFHLFVVLYEEPTLRRRFGEEYEAYRRGVRRWLPRRTPYRRG